MPKHETYLPPFYDNQTVQTIRTANGLRTLQVSKLMYDTNTKCFEKRSLQYLLPRATLAQIEIGSEASFFQKI